MERSPDASNNKEIEEIVNQFKCPREVQCCKSDFKVLCKAKDLGLETFAGCLEDDPLSCPVSVPFGHGYFCQCPLRIYIAKKLKR